MNAKKTKTMHISKNNIELTTIKLKIDEQHIEQVNEFKYMGQNITMDVSCEREIGIARPAFNNMSSVLTSRRISLKSRLRILKCYVTSFYYMAQKLGL